MKLAEAGGFFVELVEVRRLQHGVSKAEQIPHALIVRHYQDNIWTTVL